MRLEEFEFKNEFGTLSFPLLLTRLIRYIQQLNAKYPFTMFPKNRK
jgi:hypothetical protein